MTCKEYQKLFHRLNVNELAEDERAKFSAHIRQCSKCKKRLFPFKKSQRQKPSVPSHTRSKALAESSVDSYAGIATTIGKIWIGHTPRGISLISLGPNHSAEFEGYYQKRLCRGTRKGTIPKSYADAVRKAVAGKKAANVPMDLSSLSSFEHKVLQCLKQIPLGEIRPYSWLAKECGRPKAARAVGTVMARNPIPFLLPCHRVTPAGGGVGNYGYGAALKRELLKKEGVPLDELDRWARSGIRFIGSKRTNAYCYPFCRIAYSIRAEDRIPLRTIKEAHQAGFRPCPNCRPE